MFPALRLYPAHFGKDDRRCPNYPCCAVLCWSPDARLRPSVEFVGPTVMGHESACVGCLLRSVPRRARVCGGLWGHAYLICGAAALQVQKKLKKNYVSRHTRLCGGSVRRLFPLERDFRLEKMPEQLLPLLHEEGRKGKKRFMAKLIFVLRKMFFEILI